MQIQCPKCQTAIETADVAAGSEVTCPKCGSCVRSTEVTQDELDMTGSYATVIEARGVAQPIRLNADEQNELRAIFRPGVALQDRYVLERRLGSGAMGDVWLAQDSKLQRSVAIKVIQPRLLKLGYDPAQFLHESRVGANLIHPAIATVFDHGEHADKLFTVFEYLPGQTLAELIKTRGRLPLDEARLIIGPLAQALDLMHARGIIHRDLKPDNIRADEHGHFKIVDFGLASQFANQSHWGFCGTPAYAAPEQAAQRPCDGRTDQYALAVIVYELLTGQRPCCHKTHADFVQRHPNCVAAIPDDLAPDIPAILASTLLRGLQNDATQRFGSCEEFAVALGCQLLSRPTLETEPILEAEIDWRYGMGEWASVRFGRMKKAQITLTREALWACFRGEIHRWPLTAIHNVELKDKRRSLWFHYQGSRRSKLVGFKFAKRKSPLKAVLLTVAAGPFGMMYSTLVGTVVMANIHFFVFLMVPHRFVELIVPHHFAELLWLGLSYLLIWPLGSLWSAFAVRRFNGTLIGLKSPELCQTFYEALTSQKVSQVPDVSVKNIESLHPPVVLTRGRPTSNFQLLGRLEASGKRREQVEEALMLRAAVMGADVVCDLSDERIPGFQRTSIRLQGTAAKSVDQQGRIEVTARWFADQSRKLSILLMPLGGFVLVLWFIVVSFGAATVIIAQPQLLNDPQLQRKQLGAESLPVAIWTVVAAWPLLLLLLVSLLRWPQLLLAQVAVFATIALRLPLLATSMIFGAAISNNWLLAGQAILLVTDPWSWAALSFGFYSANRSWRIYRYYKSVVQTQDRKMPLNRQLAMIPVIVLSSVFIASYCWIHVQPGLQQSQNPQNQVSQTELVLFQSDLTLGDSCFAAGNLPDALKFYQKATQLSGYKSKSIN